jgi:hypothetical protein
VAPPAVIECSLAGLVPSLHEIVVYIGSSRPAHFDVKIMAMPFVVAGRSHRPGRQVDAADKCHFRPLARVDQPTLLVLEIGAVCSIPASAETRTPRPEQIAIGWRAREGPA